MKAGVWEALGGQDHHDRRRYLIEYIESSLYNGTRAKVLDAIMSDAALNLAKLKHKSTGEHLQGATALFELLVTLVLDVLGV